MKGTPISGTQCVAAAQEQKGREKNHRFSFPLHMLVRKFCDFRKIATARLEVSPSVGWTEQVVEEYFVTNNS